jgi:hypothetical protein
VKILGSVGALLVALGIAAQVFGWDTLLWLPRAAWEAVVLHPGTYGLIALGILLMVAARIFGQRRG